MKKVRISLLISVVLAAVILIAGCGGESNTSLNGVNISKYIIVYPESATDAEVRAAEYVRDAILEQTGVELKLVNDTARAKKHEILIGDTERDLSSDIQSVERGTLEFVISSDGKSVALDGEYFLVAGAAKYFVDNYVTGAEFKSEITDTVIAAPDTETPKNLIMLIGDGMGEVQTKLFDYVEFPTKDEGLLDYQEDIFFGYMFPYMGWAGTYCYDGITDSAAGGTALSTGYKTRTYYVGKDRKLNNVQNLTELSLEFGKSAAILSTDKATGATPASFTAHTPSRKNDKLIRDAQSDLREQGVIIECGWDTWTVEQIETRFYEIITQLDEDEDGFFMMYEEGYIDKHCHGNALKDTFFTVVRFNRVISIVMEYAMYNPDTFVLITADHETGGMEIVEDGVRYTRTSHSGADVPVFAYGEGAEYFDGVTMENIEIAKYFAKLMGKDDFGMPYEFEHPGTDGEEIGSQD